MMKLQLSDPAALHDCYMPFIENGGLFIASSAISSSAVSSSAVSSSAISSSAGQLDTYRLGDEVHLALTLMDEPEVLSVQGRVVWVAGASVKNPHRPGIGIQFSDPAQGLKNKIEGYLADSSGQTATM